MPFWLSCDVRTTHPILFAALVTVYLGTPVKHNLLMTAISCLVVCAIAMYEGGSWRACGRVTERMDGGCVVRARKRVREGGRGH